MTPAGALALAIGHVRNATWRLMGNGEPDGLSRGLECLDLEALLNPDDIEPATAPLEPDAARSLSAARALLNQIPDEVVPAAWAALLALSAQVGAQ